MEKLTATIQHMIRTSGEELAPFLEACFVRRVKRNEFFSVPDKVPDSVFFINHGLIRVFLYDEKGNDQTIHFALEGNFIADYANFILQKPSNYYLQATEPTEVVVLPRAAIEWGYTHLQEGQKLGRLIAEYYFIYQDERIKNNYLRSPKQRYDTITEIFPDIHNRVSQRHIASYLGITPIHLSRLKKEALKV